MKALFRNDGPALAVYLVSRTAIWALAVITALVLEERLNPSRSAWDTPRLHDTGLAVDVLARWDSNWLLRIAEEGYAWPSATPAFFPFYPALTGGLGRLLGGHYILAGAVVSLFAGATAFLLVYRLALLRLDREAALRSVLFLAVAPMSLFLGVVYTESLFLALAVGCFLAAERGRLGWAAVLAGLALLTRPQGAALLPALALFAWQERATWSRVAATCAIPAGIFLAFPLTLWAWVGHPFAFLEAEDQWGRHLTWLGPLGGPLQAVADGDAVELSFAAVMTALAVLAWRRLGAPYGIYALLVLAMAMAAPSDRLGGLYSFPRLSLVAFPCFLALAAVVVDRRLAAAISCASAALLAVYVVRWSLWYWVS